MTSYNNVGGSTKLDRKLSPINVWALAFGCIIGWGAFVMPGNTFLCKAGPAGTAIAMGIAALIMIVIALNYNFMVVRFPVAGGEFNYVQKTFGEKHAFICSWFLGLTYLTIVPLNATALSLIGRNLLGGIFQVGLHYTVAGYDVYMGEVALAIVALALFAWLSIRGVKFSGAFQTGLVICLVGGVLVVLAAALSQGMLTLSNLTPAYHPGTSELSGILSVVAIAPWAFVGFDTIPQAAEEFNFSPSKSRWIMVLSILFGALIYIILNTITAAIVPDGYSSWTEYIDDVPSLNGMISLPTFHAAYELLGSWGVTFLGISVSAAILSGLTGFYMGASRLLFSMSREQVLPAWFSKIHEQHKTPVNAILFIMAVSMIAPFFGRTALGWIVNMSSLGAAVGYGYTSASAVRFAKNEHKPAIVFTGILGVFFSVVFGLLLLVPIAGLDSSLEKESYISLAVWIVLGVFFYFYTKKDEK